MAKNKDFRFKQFIIRQDQCAMKVTSDACIFGAYIPIENAVQILDIGTGTGLLALMAAQRSNAKIIAVEINREAALQAEQNINASPWHERILVKHTSIKEYSATHSNQFDTIIANPPFYSKQKPSKQASKKMAWHNENLTHIDLANTVDALLNKNGIFCVLQPMTECQTLEAICREKFLFPMIKTVLKPFEHSLPNRIITVYTRSNTSPAKKQELIIYRSHQIYTDTLHRLLEPFSLNL